MSVVKYLNGRGWRGLTGRGVKQVFAPQCTKCSGKQGSVLSYALKNGEWGGINEGVAHFSLRPYMLAGAVVNAAKGEGGEGEAGGVIMRGVQRFRSWEAKIEATILRMLGS